jgi:hypothetical protein
MVAWKNRRKAPKSDESQTPIGGNACQGIQTRPLRIAHSLAGLFFFGLSTGLSSPLPSASLFPLSLFRLKRAIVRQVDDRV